MPSVESLANTNLNRDNVYSIITLTDLNRESEFSNLIIFEDCCYEDDVWDFSKNNIHNHDKYYFIFDFSDIDIVFKNYVKTYVLRTMFDKRKRTQTVHKSFDVMLDLTEWFIDNGIVNLESINEYEISRYFVTIDKNIETTKTFKKRVIESLLGEIEIKNPSADFSAIYKLLKNNNVGLLAAEKEEGKYKLIPTEVFNKIVSQAIRDIDNEELDIVDRMSAGMIIILAETGVRVGEFKNLQPGMLKTIKVSSNSIEFCYMKFTTYKTTGNDEGYPTKTFMSKNAIKAYLFLEDVLKSRRGESEYLYCNEKGEAFSNNALQMHLRRFFFRHKDGFGINTMSDIDKEKFRTWVIKNYHIKGISFLEKKNIGDLIYFVTAHQFRVYVATMLYKKGYNLDWIRQHMNHMSSIMTEHYIRIEELERDKKNTIEALLNRASKETGLLEINKDNIKNPDLKEELNDAEFIKAYNDINRFLRKKNLNVFKDIDEIILLLQKSKTPIVESELGFCASKGLTRLCERQEYISSINDAYYVGVKLPAIEEIEFSYTRFVEKVKTINHNKKLMKLNPKISREYEKEVNAMEKYVTKKLLPEIDELKVIVDKNGESSVIAKYPNLKDIVLNINKVWKEVSEWRTKV